MLLQHLHQYLLALLAPVLLLDGKNHHHPIHQFQVLKVH
jgi:hypothetical protein